MANTAAPIKQSTDQQNIVACTTCTEWMTHSDSSIAVLDGNEPERPFCIETFCAKTLKAVLTSQLSATISLYVPECS